MLLKLLEDQNGEVQNLAVKCLGPLVAKVKSVLYPSCAAYSIADIILYNVTITAYI